MAEQEKEGAEEENKVVFSEEEAVRQKPVPTSVSAPDTVDEYLRNFLRKVGLTRTLKSFDLEWYSAALLTVREELKTEAPATGAFTSGDPPRRSCLLEKLEKVQRETEQLRKEVLMAPENVVRLQRETFFHQQQCQRTTKEKTRLEEEIKQLEKQLEHQEQTLADLEKKHAASLRQKALIRLEKDRTRLCQEVKKEASVKRDRVDKTSAKDQRPQQTKTQQGKTPLTKPQQTRPQLTRPQQTKSQQVKPQQTEPQQVKLPQVKPQEVKSQQAKTQLAKPQLDKPPLARSHVAKPATSKPQTGKPAAARVPVAKAQTAKPLQVTQHTAKLQQAKPQHVVSS